jgi:hypothetical protein
LSGVPGDGRLAGQPAAGPFVVGVDAHCPVVVHVQQRLHNDVEIGVRCQLLAVCG